MSGNSWLRIGAILGALAVTFGAFGAHGLAPTPKALESMSPSEVTAIEKQIDTFETGACYHMYHALAIVGLGAFVARMGRSKLIDAAGWMFVLGILFFSGPLYGIGVGGPKILGAFAPIGGVLLILAWIALAFGAGDFAKSAAPSVGV